MMYEQKLSYNTWTDSVPGGTSFGVLPFVLFVVGKFGRGWCVCVCVGGGGVKGTPLQESEQHRIGLFSFTLL